MGKLVLIDGHGILHRAYHALPPLTTSKGELVNAVFGFTSMLLRVIHDLKPTHLAVCFDTPKPTFRNKMYKDYQATRPKMEENLSSQIGLVHKVVEEMRIPIYEMDGYEADDILGTLAYRVTSLNVIPSDRRESRNLSRMRDSLRQDERSLHFGRDDKREKNTFEVIIVTGDRDILQLVSDKVKVYMPVKGLSESKLYGEKEVEEKFGIKPSQIVDYKALVGDQSDNYPGVPGVGPKTAANLLSCFQTLEQIYQQINRVENEGLRKKLKENFESAEMAKKLAMIVTDVPITADLEKCRLQNLDRQNVHQLFEELEFRSLISRLTSNNRQQRTKNKGQIVENKRRESQNIKQTTLF